MPTAVPGSVTRSVAHSIPRERSSAVYVLRPRNVFLRYDVDHSSAGCESGVRVLLWVIRVGLAAFRLLPLYADERTSLPCVGMSEMCQTGQPNADRLLTRSCRSCAAHGRMTNCDGSAVAGRRARWAGNAGAYRNDAGAGPARRKGDARGPAEKRQGFSDGSVIATRWPSGRPEAAHPSLAMPFVQNAEPLLPCCRRE
jgi:hypothetical protein